MNLILKRPLAFFDIEATGLSVTNDRIVEIAIVKILPNGSRQDFLKRVNPECKISSEATGIHGITNDDVKDEPKFKDILPELESFILDSDIAGFNSNKFDLPLLAEELLRAGSLLDLASKKHIDVQNIFHKMEQRTLIAAYQFYCEKDLNNAHSALADAEATWEVLDAQLAKYDNLESDVEFLDKFSRYAGTSRADFAGRLAYNKNHEMIYNFGKHKDKTIREVMEIEPGYYGWMLNADFPLYTKKCLKQEMEKIKAENNRQNDDDLNEKLNALKNKFKK